MFLHYRTHVLTNDRPAFVSCISWMYMYTGEATKCYVLPRGGGFDPQTCMWDSFSPRWKIRNVCVCVYVHSVSCQALQVSRKSIRQAGAAAGLLNVGSGLQGRSTQASLITAQMPLFIFRIVQLILVPCRNLWGNLTCYCLSESMPVLSPSLRVLDRHSK